MENVAWEDLPLEKIYELFASLRGVQRAFGALKSRLGADGLEGMALFRYLKEKLSSQKTWKARDVVQLLEKRANQNVYLQQKAAEGAAISPPYKPCLGIRYCKTLATEQLLLKDYPRLALTSR